MKKILAFKVALIRLENLNNMKNPILQRWHMDACFVKVAQVDRFRIFLEIEKNEDRMEVVLLISTISMDA